MARPRKNRFLVFNVVSNSATLVNSFGEAVAVFSPDTPTPENLKLEGIGSDGSVSLATLGDWRIVRL